MNDSQPSATIISTSFSPAELRRRRISALNRPAWRSFLLATACFLASGLVGQIWSGAGAGRVLVVSLGNTAGLVFAVRFLLIDTWGRRFWVVWLGLGVLALLIAGSYPAGRWIAFGLVFVFLLFRRYRAYRHLSSAQRAQAFGLGLIVLLLLIFLPDRGDHEDAAYPLGLIWNMGECALYSAILFWFLSLWHLVINMRLHFLRLRPKLAASAVLLGLVPLVLVILLGLLIIFGALGGSRAVRARDVLVAWGERAEAPATAEDTAAVPSFAWSVDGRLTGQGTPNWVPSLAAELLRVRDVDRGVGEAAEDQPADAGDVVATAVDSTAHSAARETDPRDEDRQGGVTFDDEELPWTPADTTAYFLVRDQIWLIQVQGLGPETTAFRGWQLEKTLLDELSGMMKADVGLLAEDRRGGDWEFDGWADEEIDREPSFSLQGRFGEAATDSSFWHHPLYFGGAMLGVVRADGLGGFETSATLLNLQVDLAGLGREFFGGKNNFNLAWLVGLAVVAGLFLIIEFFALFFSFRIAGGIFTAVGKLHRGTMRLADGDLSTRIDIPNEDEFGDLAASFNQMTAAVAKGQADAIAHERLTREVETAREIQQRLLPHDSPELLGFEITGTSVPSRQVGGDYYDFLAQGDGRIGIAVGDVSGKGMPAALLMSNLQASLQGQVIHPSSVAEVVTRVNDLLAGSTDPHMFATFFYGVLDTRAGTFTSTNAGHNPPIVQRADGTVQTLGTGGLILGMLPEQPYQQETINLEPGDMIVLYTDGITEAVAAAVPGAASSEADAAPLNAPQAAAEMETEVEMALDEDPDAMFGEEALLAVIAASSELPAAGIKEAILTAVAQHTAGAPQSDDITLVVVKRLVA